MKVLLVVLKLVLLGGLFIISNNNLYMSDHGDREVFFGYYFSWMKNVFVQGFDMTAYVVGFKWLPDLEDPGSVKPVDSLNYFEDG